MKKHQFLRDLLVRRSQPGDHQFVLRCVKNHSWTGRERVADIYKVELDPSKPLITTPALRKWTIENGIETWGAGGYCPVLVFGDGSRWIATIYRDSKAPSWPDTYTIPSGLCQQLKTGSIEPLERASEREFDEELFFLNKRSLGAIQLDSRGSSLPALNEFLMPRTLVNDGRTIIKVYQGDRLVEESKPFAIGWSTKKDTVTTVVYSSVLHVGSAVRNPDDMFLLNGEAIEEEGRSGILSREADLLNLDDIVRSPVVRMVRYRANFEEDKIYAEKIRKNTREIRMTEPLAAAIRKIRELPEKEYASTFAQLQLRPSSPVL